MKAIAYAEEQRFVQRDFVEYIPFVGKLGNVSLFLPFDKAPGVEGWKGFAGFRNGKNLKGYQELAEGFVCYFIWYNCYL
ncbi:MAG: hypothetical protein EOO01_16640 [Chitinophagaceae bacterium]|nr:MAG: hypothetical protein EOO01_16640 [Chitinophagaceae bacterium]